MLDVPLVTNRSEVKSQNQDRQAGQRCLCRELNPLAVVDRVVATRSSEDRSPPSSFVPCQDCGAGSSALILFSRKRQAWDCRLIFQNRKTLGADCMHCAAEFLDPFCEPGQFLGCCIVVLGITRLDVCLLELLEHRALSPMVGRLHVGEVMINPLGLSAQKAEIVHIRRVERHNKQHAVV